MKNLTIAVRSLFRKERHNGIKILSLGVGLAMGLVLIAKVCFELSYDDFYPDGERIYQIRANMEMGEKKMEDADRVSGGIAPAMKLEVPGVEAATRGYPLGNLVFFMSDKNKYKARYNCRNTISAAGGKDKQIYHVVPYKVKNYLVCL